MWIQPSNHNNRFFTSVKKKVVNRQRFLDIEIEEFSPASFILYNSDCLQWEYKTSIVESDRNIVRNFEIFQSVLFVLSLTICFAVDGSRDLTFFLPPQKSLKNSSLQMITFQKRILLSHSRT